MVMVMKMVKRRDCMSMLEWPSFQNVKVLKSPRSCDVSEQGVKVGCFVHTSNDMKG